MAAAVSKSNMGAITQLPEVPLALIFSKLSFDDALTCKLVCKRFKDVISRIPAWRKWCYEAWLLTECPADLTWHELFLEANGEWGRYRSCYARIRRAWNIIEDFTRVHCPEIYGSLREGASEDYIRQIEDTKLAGLAIPDDMRCSLRIHDGQEFASYGLIGSMAISDYYRTEKLMDLATSANDFKKKSTMKNCMQVTLCRTGDGQFVAITDQYGFNTGEIFWPKVDDRIDDPDSSLMHQLRSASCFSDFLCEYADKLSRQHYPVIDGQIYTFGFSSACTTNGIEVRTATAFVPEQCPINLGQFFFTYRISISMHPDCSEMDRCQLVTRHWYITDADGFEEEVHGPAVVGEYPIMYPGALHEYVSCTHFSTPKGIMTGYYTFVYLNKDGEFNVTIPPMNFQSLPVVTPHERIQRAKNRLLFS